LTRVSLVRRTEQDIAAPPLLDPLGARVILGGTDGLAAPVVPGPCQLFGPRGALLAGKGGPLFVADTGHHRLLIWSRAPETDNAPADIVIGQPDFFSEGRNGKSAVSASRLNVPTGIAWGDGVLAVADAWNHRVLLWFGAPRRSNQPADLVLGQADFLSGAANRGQAGPGADTLNWCYGVAIADGRLLVADTGNRRLLVWNEIPHVHGQPADRVLGQVDFVTRDENGGGGVDRAGMRWPHGIVAGDGLFVADAGNNRIMGWRSWPQMNGAPCDFVLGQAGFTGNDHNCARYDPGAASLNMPYGLAAQGGRLIVADTANSRLLEFAQFHMGAPAERLAGQFTFNKKGDNRWGAPARANLCWPYSVAACENALAIADSGNNRVLLWDMA
jgi:hypothetical protein